MKRLRLCAAGWGLGAALLVLAPSLPTLAEPPPGPTPAQQKEADKLYEQGRKAAKAKQWAKASEFYLLAYRIDRHWKIAASLGNAELQAGKQRDAAEHLATALREAPATLGDADRKAMQEALDGAKAKVGALNIRADPGAYVLVNGQVVGQAPLPGVVFVEPGSAVAVETRMEGYAPARESRTVAAGKEEEVKLLLKREPPPVSTPPPAGSETQPVAPPAGGEVKPVDLTAGGEVKPVAPPVGGDAPPAARRGPNRTILIAGGAVSLAFLGMGVTTGVLSKVKEGERPLKPVTCAPGCDYNRIETSRASLAKASFAGLFIGGVAAAATAVYFVVETRAAAKKPVSAAVAVDGKSGQLIISSEW